MVIYLDLLVALVGLLVYVLCNTPGTAKIAELGRISFFAGLLAFLLSGAHLLSVLR